MKNVFVIADVYTNDIYCVATTEGKARKAIDILTERAIKNIIAEDSEESGIDWEIMTTEEKGELKESTKSTFYILPFADYVWRNKDELSADI